MVDLSSSNQNSIMSERGPYGKQMFIIENERQKLYWISEEYTIYHND